MTTPTHAPTVELIPLDGIASGTARGSTEGHMASNKGCIASDARWGFGSRSTRFTRFIAKDFILGPPVCYRRTPCEVNGRGRQRFLEVI